jgi:hypothetical protein
MLDDHDVEKRADFYLRICEFCSHPHYGVYGTGRFCRKACRYGYIGKVTNTLQIRVKRQERINGYWQGMTKQQRSEEIVRRKAVTRRNREQFRAEAA